MPYYDPRIMSKAPASFKPTPAITPYLSPSQGGSPNVPVGQTGNSYSSGFIGPVPRQYGAVGAPVTSTKILGVSSYKPPNAVPVPTPQMSPSQNPNNFDRSNIDQNVDTGNEQIDRDYNDFMLQLSGSEQGLQNQATNATQNVDINYAPNLSALQNEGATKLAGNAEQGRIAQTQEKTAMMKARDLFRQQQQSNIISLSGMGLSSSSVAQALAETLGVETARRIASVSQSANDIYQGLAKERANIESYVAEKKTELQAKIAQEKTNIQYQLGEGLRQINEARATAAKDKANRRADLLQQANNAIYTLQQNAQQFAQSLEQWKTQNTNKLTSLSQVDWNTRFAQDLASVQQAAGSGYDVSGNIDNNKGAYDYGFSIKPSKKTEDEEDL